VNAFIIEDDILGINSYVLAIAKDCIDFLKRNALGCPSV
jgi:hypothetical protein